MSYNNNSHINNYTTTENIHQYYKYMKKLKINKINLYFNRKCKQRRITPNFINIKINNKTDAAIKAKEKAKHVWISEIIKTLYRKINSLTTLVYNLQLILSKTLHRIEYENTLDTIENNIEKILRRKRRTIKKKLVNLTRQQKHIQHTNQQIKINHKFYQRIHNATDITFNETEQKILNKGLKFNVAPSDNNTQRIRNLLEIENAIKRTDEQHQEDIRTLVTIDIHKDRTNKPQNTHKKERQTIKDINKKLKENNAIITKADKGNTLVILSIEDYYKKINEYIENNNITKLTEDPTNKYHKNINKTINTCTTLFNQKQIRRLKTIKPTAPKIRGQPKTHKTDMPIRPVINFTTAPAYKVAKEINRYLNNNLHIKIDRAIKNNIELINKIESIVIPPTAKLASFDITNMYTNIPIKETIDITEKLLKNSGIQEDKIDDIISLLNIITAQNYFQHNDEFYSQTDGLPMGNPLSGTLANIYINHLENNHILTDENPIRNKIIYWHRYVDDILILFNGTTRQLHNLHNKINNIHKTIKFTLETETNKSINFLDLTITNNDNKHTFKIYRKPTQTDHTIDKTSNHPFQHKMAAFRFLINRLNTIPMHPTDYTEELNTIKYMAIRNGYESHIIDKMNKKHIKKAQQYMTTTLRSQENKTEKYISVEYNPYINRKTINAFKKYGYTIAYKTNQKLGHKLNQQKKTPPNSGIYKNTCDDCTKFYIGQTGRTFEIRFNEHIKEIGKERIDSKYAQHLTTENHKYTDMNTNSHILHRLQKGPLMNRLEELEIYKERKNPNLLNERIGKNKIYDIIIKHLIHNHSIE